MVADESKLVEKLGTKAELPVELAPYGSRHTLRELREQCRGVSLKSLAGAHFVSDNGNYVALMDFRPQGIDRPADVDAEVKGTLGVLETGLFLGMARRAFVAGKGGVHEVGRR